MVQGSREEEERLGAFSTFKIWSSSEFGEEKTSSAGRTTSHLAHLSSLHTDRPVPLVHAV